MASKFKRFKDSTLKEILYDEKENLELDKKYMKEFMHESRQHMIDFERRIVSSLICSKRHRSTIKEIEAELKRRKNVKKKTKA